MMRLWVFVLFTLIGTSAAANKTPFRSVPQDIDIHALSDQSWIVSTQSGFFKCDRDLTQCDEVIPKDHTFYDTRIYNLYDQGLIFPTYFGARTNTNSSKPRADKASRRQKQTA